MSRVYEWSGHTWCGLAWCAYTSGAAPLVEWPTVVMCQQVERPPVKRRDCTVVGAAEVSFSKKFTSYKLKNRVSDPHFFWRIRIRAKIFMRTRIRVLGVSGGGGWG